MKAELMALDIDIVEVDWPHELLMGLSIAEKPSPTILMNCDNQTVIVKVDSSKDNMKSSRHIKRQENEKLWSYYIGLHPNQEEPDRFIYQGVVI
jgi:hypothetical protein